MKWYTLSLLLLALAASSCSKTPASATAGIFQAVVVGQNMDCGIYQIKFLSGGDSVAPFLTGPPGSGGAIARNLPDALKVPGLKILVTIRKPQNSELGACTMMGITLPWTYVLSAKRMNPGAPVD